MTPSPQPTSTGNPTLDKLRAGQLGDPMVQRAIQYAKGMGTWVEPQQSPDATPAPRPIASPSQPVQGLGSPASAAAPAPAASAPLPSANEKEYQRVTAPPLPSSSPLAHTSADTGRSGIGQIKHAGFRIPLEIAQAIGSAFAPGLTEMIPGTDLHHQLVVGERGRAVGHEQEMLNEEANREHLGAETQQQQALANKARTPTAPTNAFELWAKQNPDAKASDWLALQTENKPDKTETPFSVWREQNPDKPAEEWLKAQAGAKPVPPNEYADFKAGYIKAHPEASPDQVVSEYAKAHAAPARVPANEYEDFKADYLKDHPNAKATEIQTAYAKVHKTPENPPHTLMIGPDNKAFEVSPGTTIPQGSQTAAGVNAVNTPTMTSRTAAGRASTVIEMAPEVLSRIDKNAPQLGPLMGRWNEFMQGKVGLDNPEFAALRSDLLMMSSAVALAHAQGRLPENLREEFDNAINAPKQTPGNLKATINTMLPWLKAMQGQGKPTADAQGGYQIGHQYGDMDYLGGDPNKQSSWRKH